MIERAIYAATLETRQERGRRILSGVFPYGALATIRDRGRVRKETFSGDAFGWQLREFAKLQDELAQLIGSAIQEVEEARQFQMPGVVQAKQAELAARNIDLLYGHSFDRPLASMLAGNLSVKSDKTALRFEATLPADDKLTTWQRDAINAVEAGLARGISPGFRVPPRSAVENAEETIPEPGNPGVLIRRINQALIPELSIVTRPAYVDSTVESRADRDAERLYRWL